MDYDYLVLFGLSVERLTRSAAGLTLHMGEGRERSADAVVTKCLKSGISPNPDLIADTSIDLKTLITQPKES